jgi:hypothetical protein
MLWDHLLHQVGHIWNLVACHRQSNFEKVFDCHWRTNIRGCIGKMAKIFFPPIPTKFGDSIGTSLLVNILEGHLLPCFWSKNVILPVKRGLSLKHTKLKWQLCPKKANQNWWMNTPDSVVEFCWKTLTPSCLASMQKWSWWFLLL